MSLCGSCQTVIGGGGNLPPSPPVFRLLIGDTSLFQNDTRKPGGHAAIPVVVGVVVASAGGERTFAPFTM